MLRKNQTSEALWEVTAPVSPGLPPASLPAKESAPPPQTPETKRTSRGIFLLLWGVLLPVIALVVELATQMCAEGIVDPLPTPFHVVLVAFVPVSNGFLWWALWKGEAKHQSLLSVTSAATIGIAAFYTLVFLPITPFAVFAIAMAGLGFLPLSPLLALTATILGRRKLQRLNAPTAGLRFLPFLLGFGLGLLSLVVVELPSAGTRIGLQMASSVDAEKSQRGIKWLRAVGSEDVMLRHCYQEQHAMNDLLTLLLSQGDAVTLAEARQIYYRVTGTPFNAVPPPLKLNRKIRTWGNDFDFDTALGGTAVAGQVKGLSLVTSRQDQSIDANAAVSYTEWTLVFRNSSPQQREARAQIALPPGGVVSRLTLWVNGEEREAAFAGRAQVREAYNQVAVQQRRDPVLVTTMGADRVLLQCFPVPSNGEMKVRLGITAPLQLVSETAASWPLPYFVERNFGINDETKHAIWIESKQPLRANVAELQAEPGEGGNYALRGSLAEAKLSDSVVQVTRNTGAKQAWARDPFSKTAEIVTQSIAAQAVVAPSRVVFVIDGSRLMKDHAPALAATLAKLPSQVESLILLASDEVVELSPGFQKVAPQVSAELLATASFGGGADNLPALLRAWEVAAEKPGSVIVWLHGVQPIEMPGLGELRRRYERRPTGPRLYDVQLIAGPNRLAEHLATLVAVEPVAHRLVGLEQLLARWNGTTPRYVLTRTKTRSEAVPGAVEGSSHLVRLWAQDEVRRLMAARANSDDIIKLAARYQLVTPVTGAVVLETKAQYDSAGLQPVNANTVPTIPEPETWALLFVVGTVLLWFAHQQRRRQPRAQV